MKSLNSLFCAAAVALLAPTMPALAAPAPAVFQIAEYDAEVEAAISEGQAALEKGHFEQAISSFQDALSTNEGDKKIEEMLKEAQEAGAAHYVTLGEALRAEKRYVDAEREFDNALDLDKENAAAVKGKAAAVNGPKADAYIKEAKARAAKGEFDYAIAYFQKAFDLVGDPSTKALLDEAKTHKKK